MSLTSLSLVDLASFVLYDYQVRLTNQLAGFTHLTSIRLEHRDFHFTDRLLNILIDLEHLRLIQISTKKVDKILCKLNAFDKFNKVRRFNYIIFKR